MEGSTSVEPARARESVSSRAFVEAAKGAAQTLSRASAPLGHPGASCTPRPKGSDSDSPRRSFTAFSKRY